MFLREVVQLLDVGGHVDEEQFIVRPERRHLTAVLRITQQLPVPLADDPLRAFAAAESCDLVVALGSTLSVSPANTIPLRAAQAGTPYIIINRDETDHDGLSQVSLRLSGNVEDLFPSAVADAL